MQVRKMRLIFELKLPQDLKSCLVEDWELINKHKQLFQLPAEKNVDTILEEYVTFVKSQGKADNSEYSVDELVYGIREYFNKMLGTQLLYQFEKPQSAEIHLLILILQCLRFMGLHTSYDYLFKLGEYCPVSSVGTVLC
ncbi:Mortality factor 4-like protein 2 [Microtus ochrogaster]|uniref:Mortality factor 4-like protein 2 n=1 Tax=Microtus ochrogaster TaxID=79684 RepID=A0A8J6GJ96_MICOH|nr:Mortality factor 4-like protein 2 [Microtus ochrogaster]